MGVDQTALGEDIGVSQGTVSEWESGEHPAPAMALMALGRLDYANTTWWYEQAGPKFAERLKLLQAIQKVRAERFAKTQDPRIAWIPLLHDSVAAGPPREIDERDIELEMPFTSDLLPRGGKLYALRVAGNSMTPIVNEGYVVIVDMNQREPGKLVGRMVAAREDNAVTIKWLRSDKDLFLLVPHHVSLDIPVRVMREEDDQAIVGAVIKWVGYPPPIRK